MSAATNPSTEEPSGQNPSIAEKAIELHPKLLSPLLVWAVVFCDIGTSVYYVPGILYGQIGSLAPLMVLAVTVGFLLLASKYIEICWRNPEGGGVVTVSTKAFSPRFGVFGGLLITVDYFLTSAVSAVSGMHYLGSVIPVAGENVVMIAVIALSFLALINVIGIRESAGISLMMAVSALAVSLAVILVTVIMMGPPQWDLVWQHVKVPSGVPLTTLLVGFGGAWLAFSGLESISQLSPAMQSPLKGTAHKGMMIVIVTVLLTSPLLTLFSVSLLSDSVKVTGSERFISELGDVYGGLPLKVAVVVTASVLLLFAANTAIIGTYHVFLALANQNFLPSIVTRRNKRFSTPHWAILLATVVPIGVIVFTKGNLALLGEMYAFGLLGAFVLSSGGLDVIRYREGQRGTRFWVGILTTGMVLVAWIVVIITKHQATIFGGIVVGIGMLIAIPYKQGLFFSWFYKVPMMARLASKRITEAERSIEDFPELISLSAAESIAPLYPSRTLVAVLGQNPRLIDEAITREKGLAGNFIYALYVEERPGLFVDPTANTPTQQAKESLLFAYREAQQQNFNLIPVWTISYTVAEGVARAARALNVDTVVLGVGHRSAIYHLLRGHVVNGLIGRLPENCHLMLFN